MEHDCIQNNKITSLCKFQGSTESDIKTIFKTLSDIKNNDLRHVNTKLNALLFTVLGSVFVAIIVIAIKLLTKTL